MYISNRICRSAARIAASHAGKFCSASSNNSTALPSLAGAPDARSSARSPTCASASERDAAGGCKGTIRLSQTSIRLSQTSGVGHRSHRRLSFGLVAGAPEAIQEETTMKIVRYCLLAAWSALSLMAGVPATAQDTVKIGLILPMTGPFASTGRQVETAVKL